MTALSKEIVNLWDVAASVCCRRGSKNVCCSPQSSGVGTFQPGTTPARGNAFYQGTPTAMENAISVVSLPQILPPRLCWLWQVLCAQELMVAPLSISWFSYSWQQLCWRSPGTQQSWPSQPCWAPEPWQVPLIVVRGDTCAVLGIHPPRLGSHEGVEMLIFGTPHSESFNLVASPVMLETKIHFLFRKREKIRVQPPALATSSINSLCSRALLLFVLVAFSL